MSRIHSQSNVALSFPPYTPSDGAIELDDLVRLACRGDESAAAVVVYELHPLILMEVLPQLPESKQHLGEEIADGIIEAMLAGRIRPRREPGETLATVLRLAGVAARRRARQGE